MTWAIAAKLLAILVAVAIGFVVGRMGRERGQFGIRGSVRTDVTGAALTDMGFDE